MCRNIRQLHNFEPPATSDEVHDAALQYVRKISGSTKPSQANAEAFDRAVDEVAAATQALLDEMVTNAPPKNREEEAEKRRARCREALRRRLAARTPPRGGLGLRNRAAADRPRGDHGQPRDVADARTTSGASSSSRRASRSGS